MFAVPPDEPAFIKAEREMSTARRQYDFYRSNAFFKAGFVDGWYNYTVRSAYYSKTGYRIGLTEGRKQAKAQRLINLLQKQHHGHT